MLGQRAHAGDPAAADTASTEPLIEPELACGGDHAIALERDPDVVELQERRVQEGAFEREVDRSRQHTRDLLAVGFAGLDDLCVHATGHPHGDIPQRGHPAA